MYNRKEIDKEAKIMESEVLLAEKEDRYGNKIDKKGEKLGLEPKKDPFKIVKVSDTEEIDSEKFEVVRLKIKEGNLTCEVLNGTYNEIKKTKKVNFEKGINFNIVLTEYSLKDNPMMDYKKNLGIKQILDSLNNKMENILDFEIEKERKKDLHTVIMVFVLIGFLIAFICIPELIGNHDSIESFTSAKPIVRCVVRIILSIFLFFAIFTLLGLLMDNGLL